MVQRAQRRPGHHGKSSHASKVRAEISQRSAVVVQLHQQPAGAFHQHVVVAGGQLTNPIGMGGERRQSDLVQCRGRDGCHRFFENDAGFRRHRISQPGYLGTV